MPKTRPPYSPEFRRQVIDLVRAGRSPEDLAREFEPTAQLISNWVVQADKQEGRREDKADGLSVSERDESARLRRENKQLRVERDILSRAAAWFARASAAERMKEAVRPGFPVHERKPGHLPDLGHGARAWRVRVGLPCVAAAPGLRSRGG